MNGSTLLKYKMIRGQAGLFACFQRHHHPANFGGKAVQTAKVNHNSSFPNQHLNHSFTTAISRPTIASSFHSTRNWLSALEHLPYLRACPHQSRSGGYRDRYQTEQARLGTRKT